MTAPEARDGRARQREIRRLLVEVLTLNDALIVRLDDMRRQARDAAETLRRMP